MGGETVVYRKRSGLTRMGGSCAARAFSPACARAYAYDEVAREAPERVRQIVRETLERRIVDDETDHAKLQLARLAPAMQIAAMAVADGDVKAMPFLKALDRLDRYQRAAKVNHVYDEDARKRLFDEITRVAANLGLNHARTAAEGRLRARIRKERPGMEEEKEKMARGSAQPFEKARFGEGNPRISLAQIWPGFAGFGSNLAEFGSIWIFLGWRAAN
jgi:hypothetical protein